MKRSLIILSILLPAYSWAQPREDLSERALELCQFIPDHGLKPEARDYMTPEFFGALSEAFDAPVVDYGEIGDNEKRSDVTQELFDDVAEYPAEMVRVDGQWLLDDFDGKKAECVDYVKEMRAKYESGELLKYMESEDYLLEYVPDFKRRVDDFYEKYGKE